MAATKKNRIDSYEERTDFHKDDWVIALNKRFPDLSGFGLICALKQKCARETSGKILFTQYERSKIADQLNININLFNKIMEYLIREAKQVSVSQGEIAPHLTITEIEMIVKKKLNRREAKRRAMADSRDKKKLKNGIRVDGRESESAKRMRIFRSFDSVLILTEEIVNDVSLKYPIHGDIRVYFKYFIEFVKSDYANNWGNITSDNYVVMFYTYMNQYDKPLAEALTPEERSKLGRRGIRDVPIRFSG